MADLIRLVGIAATGYHGVLAEERRDGQTFVADVTLQLDTREAAAGDRLDATVDYAAVAVRVSEILAGEPADLIETVAERIAAALLADPRVDAVDVVLHKPQAPIPVPFTDVTVEIHRDRGAPPAVPAPGVLDLTAGPDGPAVVAAPAQPMPTPAQPMPTWAPLSDAPEPMPVAPLPPAPAVALAAPVPAAPAGVAAPLPTIADLVLPSNGTGEVPALVPDGPAEVPLDPAVRPGEAPGDDAGPASPAAARGLHAADPTPNDRMDVAPDAPVQAVLALGSNVGASQDTLRAAVRALAEIPGVEVTRVGPLARTAAVGGPEQPDFLNTVVLVRTTLSPRDLLRACLEIEAGLGRVRSEHWGPRTLDIDVVVHGATIGVTDDLELPHPRAHERAFVLLPWAQADPTAVLPGLGGGPVAVLAETAPDRGGVRWVNLDWWTAG